MDLSIITVPWNVRDLVRDNFKAIYKNTHNISFEIIAVDNDSKDSTGKMIAREFPRVILVANNHNAGFAKANNQGIKKSVGRYVLLLNPDMRVKEGTLEKMINWMDRHPAAGLAGCRLVKDDGKIVPHVRRFPTLLNQLAIIFKIPHLYQRVLSSYLMDDFDYSKEQEVDSIRGSFFMIRREVLEKIGMLDERYFLWFEEVDFCKRVHNAGYKVVYTPIAECVDYVGKSFGQVKKGKLQLIFRDSMLKYFRKWHPGWQWLLLWLSWPIGIMQTWVLVKFGYKGKAKT